MRYSSSLHNLAAEATYPSSVTSQTDVNYFSIWCNSTELEWSIFGPELRNVKITMTRPDGSSRVFSIPNTAYVKEHFRYKIFSSDDLYNDAGKVIEGDYKVQASGSIHAGNGQTQNNSFTFYVNLNAPTIALKAGNVELNSYDITRSNVTVSASDTYGTPTLKYSRSTGDSFPSSATTSFQVGRRFLMKANIW